MDCLLKKLVVQKHVLEMSQFPDSDSNISFLSEYEYMNPSYRSSMEDTVVIERALKDDPNLFFAALMDGHGGLNRYANS